MRRHIQRNMARLERRQGGSRTKTKQKLVSNNVPILPRHCYELRYQEHDGGKVRSRGLYVAEGTAAQMLNDALTQLGKPTVAATLWYDGSPVA